MQVSVNFSLRLVKKLIRKKRVSAPLLYGKRRGRTGLPRLDEDYIELLKAVSNGDYIK